MRLSQGLTRYRDEGQGTPILLVHGMGLKLELWDDHAADLARDHRVIRLDMLGHGQSEAPAGHWSFKEHARQIADLLDYLAIDRAFVVGFSLGGTVSQRFAIDYPNRISGLIVVASVCDRTETEQQAVLERLKQVRDGGPAAVAHAAIDRWFTVRFQAEHPDIVERWFNQILSNDHRAYANAYSVYASTDGELRHLLPGISAPTLVITGDRDAGQNPRMAAAMASRIPTCEVIILPGIAHMLPLEAPAELAETIRTFVQRGIN